MNARIQAALSSSGRATRCATTAERLEDAGVRRGRLWHGRARGRTPPSSRRASEGIRGRAVPADHALPVPVRGRSPTLAERVKAMLVVELSLGQMVEDVRLAVDGRCPVRFFGRTGGVVVDAGGGAGGRSAGRWRR